MTSVMHSPSPFLYEGIQPVCVEGRFLRARFLNKENEKILSIEEFKDNAHEHNCPRQISHLHAEYIVPLPKNICKREGDRLLGTPVCIGCQGNRILLQYTTENEHQIQFMMADVEMKTVFAWPVTCRHFLREYVLTAPLECYLDFNSPYCLLRLSPSMLRVRRSLAIQSTLFNSAFSTSSKVSDASVVSLPVEAVTGLVDVKSVINSRFLNVLPFEPGRVFLVTVDEFAVKFNFELLDTSSLMISKLATRILRNEFQNSNLLQCKACRTRECDAICVTCLTIDQKEDDTSMRTLRVMTFEIGTFEILTTYTYNVSKTFKAQAQREIMLTVAPCDLKVEIWAVKRGCTPLFIKSLNICRRKTCLKSMCRSVILHHTNEWDLEKLNLPLYLHRYLRFQTQ